MIVYKCPKQVQSVHRLSKTTQSQWNNKTDGRITKIPARIMPVRSPADITGLLRREPFEPPLLLGPDEPVLVGVPAPVVFPEVLPALALDPLVGWALALAPDEENPSGGAVPIAPAVSREAAMPFVTVACVTQLELLGVENGASGVMVSPTV